MNLCNQIRRSALKYLRGRHAYRDMVVAEINGHNFAAADIALPNIDKQCHVYRLIVIKHN